MSLARQLMVAGFKVQARTTVETSQLPTILAVNYRRLGVVVDMNCPYSTALIHQASTHRLFSRLHWWLLVAEDSSGIPLARSTAPPLDSHVTYVWEQGGRFHLVEVYQVTEDSNPESLPAASWEPGTELPHQVARDNLHGAVLRAGIVTVEDSWNHHTDLRYKHLDTWNKFSYAVATLVAQMINCSMNETHVDSWGYKSEEGNFTGMVGLLQRGEIDIGGVSLMTTERLNVLDYTADTPTFRPRFVFRQPSLSSVSNIYLMPFSAGVWATYVVSVVVLTVVMFRIQWMRWQPANVEPHSRDWSEIMLSSLGTTCQQGWQKTPQDVSSRIIFLCLDLLSIFFFTSYSAIVVSLLQSPSSSINNLEDLIKSPMRIALYDIIYNHNVDNYMNISASPVAERLFKERIMPQPQQEVYLSQEEGMELVRQGRFAFHVEIGAYKYIADTWQEAEKCDLVELYMFPPCTTSLIPVPKGSPYKKLLTLNMWASDCAGCVRWDCRPGRRCGGGQRDRAARIAAQSSSALACRTSSRPCWSSSMACSCLSPSFCWSVRITASPSPASLLRAEDLLHVTLTNNLHSNMTMSNERVWRGKTWNLKYEKCS